MNQPTNQSNQQPSTNQPMNQPINQPTKSINQPTDQSINQSIHQINQSINQINQSINVYAFPLRSSRPRCTARHSLSVPLGHAVLQDLPSPSLSARYLTILFFAMLSETAVGTHTRHLLRASTTGNSLKGKSTAVTVNRASHVERLTTPLFR